MNMNTNARIAEIAAGAEWTCRAVLACDSAGACRQKRGGELWH